MKSSMTLFGCGPKMALLSLPYVILSVAVMLSFPDFLKLEFLNNPYTEIAGFVWLGAGLVFWVYSAVFFLKNFKPGTLLTKGPKISIHGEEAVLRRIFDEDFEIYEKSVNQIFPFPSKS